MTLGEAKSGLIKIAQRRRSPYSDANHHGFTGHWVACAKYWRSSSTADAILMLDRQMNFVIWDWTGFVPKILKKHSGFNAGAWTIVEWDTNAPPHQISDWYKKNGYYDF